MTLQAPVDVGSESDPHKSVVLVQRVDASPLFKRLASSVLMTSKDSRFMSSSAKWIKLPRLILRVIIRLFGIVGLFEMLAARPLPCK